MFREIRRSERITDTDRKKQAERDRLLAELLDSRIGSERWIKAKAALDEFDKANTNAMSAFDPDARV